MADLKCPVCHDAIYRIDLSNDVCENHLDLLVIKCSDCGKYAFSDNIAFCRNCEPISFVDTATGSPDRRAYLRYVGMEGWD